MNLIKVPFGLLNFNKNLGTERAPEEIVKNLERFYLPENHQAPNFQVKEILAGEEIGESFRRITEKSREFFRETEQNIFLGGDHSITYPIFRAFAQAYAGAGIVIFDAHPDCQSELNPPTHEDLLVGLLKDNLVKKENIILVGLRNWSPEEYAFLKQNQIKFFTMGEIASEGIKEVSEAVMASAKNFGALYVSVDIDVLDRAFAPGTGYPEPGGLSTRELLFFLQRLKKLRNFRAADLVEINPEIDSGTALVGAKIVTELF